MYGFWWKKLVGKMAPEDFYPKLCEQMSSTTAGIPIIALVYILGIAACTFHFANGLWGFCFSWGITISRRSQQMAAWVFGILGVLVFFLGANTTIYFATGSSIQDMLFGRGETTGTRSCLDITAEASKPQTAQSAIP
jgi:succinate dehydrogenase/fumarate reductase cytochrome b subunit